MKRQAIALLVAIAILVCLATFLRDHLAVTQLADHEWEFRRWIETHPLISFGAGLGAYYIISMVPGTSGKSIVLGWLFGFWQGVVIAEAALTAAAFTSFTLSRYVFRGLVESRLAEFLERFQQAIDREGAFYLLTLRMLHFPFSAVNYGSGVTGIQSGTFAWTTAVGLLPGTLVFVFLGAQLPTLHELVEHGSEQLLHPWLLFALLATGILPLLVRWLVRGRRHSLIAKPASAMAPRREPR